MFWENLELLLKKQKETDKAFCERSGLVYKTFCSQKLNKQLPKLEQAILMADALEISLDELVGRSTPVKLEDKVIRRLINEEDKLRAVATLMGME